MKRNRRLLLKTAKRIESLPYTYDQGEWGSETDVTPRTPCGTTACLAGEIIICSERSLAKGVAKLLAPKTSIPTLARQLAGLTRGETWRLFMTSTGAGWPDKFYLRYSRAKTQRAKAKVAADLLRYVADGGEV